MKAHIPHICDKQMHIHSSSPEIVTHFVLYYFFPFPCPRASLIITPIFAITTASSSAGKESVCSAGDTGSIRGSRRSTEEGIGYLLQYSWASLVTQTVKNPPEMWDIWIQSLGWEDSLEKGMATHSSILSWRIPMDSKPGGL